MRMFRGLLAWLAQGHHSATVTIFYKNGDKQVRTFVREQKLEAWDDAHAFANAQQERFGHRIRFQIM